MKKRILGGLLILCLMFAAGCGQGEKEARIADLDYTVLDEGNVPQELKEVIEGKKTTAFKLTYSDSQYLYLAVGYGEQASGGYSIQVNDLYLTENHIYLDADLLGPKRGEEVAQAVTYPWIVIKLEYRTESVVFDVG